MAAMKSPVHPGEILREEVIKPLDLTVGQAAEILGVARQTLSRLLNERGDLTPEMAFKIEAAFGAKADVMMRVQLAHNMAKADKRRPEITRGIKRYRATAVPA